MVSRLRSLAIFLYLATCSALVCADGVNAAPSGISVHAAGGNGLNRLALNWESPVLWRRDMAGGSRLELDVEIGVAFWRSDSRSAARDAWQFGAIPMIRWWPGERWYLEGGIGPTVFSTTHLGSKKIGTAFQFGDQVGAGVQLSSSDRLGLRYAHFSNAGIKRPNPGLNICEVVYTRAF